MVGDGWKVWAMLRNLTSGADRLANAARAAGFVMATPDDRPEDIPAVVTKAPEAMATAWTSAQPQRALVVVAPRAATYPAMFRDWMASFNWRAPA